MLFFFFKQKTAYELRISDWSSDVFSSDLQLHARPQFAAAFAFDLICCPVAGAVLFYGVRFCEQLLRQLFSRGKNARAPNPDTAVGKIRDIEEIGRASCRERVCQYV